LVDNAAKIAKALKVGLFELKGLWRIAAFGGCVCVSNFPPPPGHSAMTK